MPEFDDLIKNQTEMLMPDMDDLEFRKYIRSCLMKNKRLTKNQIR